MNFQNVRRFGHLLSALTLATASVSAWASTPASHTLAVPASATAAPIVVTWTGSALPGASGAASSCQKAADDSHDIVLSVPAGTYNNYSVTADFVIEFDAASGNDLVLSVYNGSTVQGSSDTSSNIESVRVTNPTAGTLSAVVCPFLGVGSTAYKAKLTLTPVPKAACVVAPSTVKSNAVSTEAPASLLDPEATGLPNLDLFRSSNWNKVVAEPAQAAYAGRIQSATFDRVLGVPTFLWASEAAQPAAVGALPSEKEILAAQARAHLRNEAKLLKINNAMIDSASIDDAQYNGNGPAVVRLNQRVNGYEVYQRQLSVMIDRDGKPVATSGYFANNYGTPSSTFAISAPQAIAAAWGNLGGTLNAGSLLLKQNQGEYQWWSLTSAPIGSHLFEREPRSRKLYYANGNQLIPAYYVELFAVAKTNRNLSAYSFIISATDGSILARDNLKAAVAPGATSKPWSYRMFADTTPPYTLFDQPLGNGYTPFPALDPKAVIARVANPSSPNLVTLSYGPITSQDAWLADTATQTIGNNTDACADKFDPANSTLSTPYNTCTDPLSTTQGDFYPAPSGDHAFDYTALADKDPSTTQAKNAAVVSLFYLNNWLHDWWYDHGFNEAAKNAQTNNYTRGGTAADPVKAQGQDGSGRNNANMATPADGSSPTMQQYLFDGTLNGEVRQTAPTDGGKLKFTGASFGPQTFDITGDAVLANDGAGVSNTDGCGVDANPANPPVAPPAAVPVPPAPPQVSLNGKIALIDRGNCNFSYKEQFAMESNAKAMVVITNNDAEPITMGNADVPVSQVPPSTTAGVYQTPAVMIRKSDGAAIKALLAAGKTVTLHVQRQPSIDRDGTLDNQIVGHEFFHYVHHRLTASSNQQANAMSEGWGDIDALMISVRADDTAAADNDKWQGAYGLAGYVIDNFYFGIRRAPYSTDAKKNAYTLKHIGNGVATPDGGAGATNSEVHAAGEIWANEMWNCYAGILNTADNGTFSQKQYRMQDYIIAGLKLTPANATYTEARDAILAAVVGGKNFADYKACSDGFAARGSGLNAVSPARDSTTLTGATDDTTPFVCKSTTTTTPAPTPTPTVPVTTITPAVADTTTAAKSEGRFGGGALGLALLLPMAGLALRRRSRRTA